MVENKNPLKASTFRNKKRFHFNTTFGPVHLKFVSKRTNIICDQRVSKTLKHKKKNLWLLDFPVNFIVIRRYPSSLFILFMRFVLFNVACKFN